MRVLALNPHIPRKTSEPAQPSTHRHETNDDEYDAECDDQLADRSTVHFETLLKVPRGATSINWLPGRVMGMQVSSDQS